MKSSINVITKLSDALLPKLSRADEIWVAVGLISFQGLAFILDNTSANCKKSFLVGIDLPTDPKALNRLNNLRLKSELDVRLYTGKEFFHPKFYLVRSGDTLSGFVGSANCTGGGLNKNIELSFLINDRDECKHLKSWFDQTFKQAKPLNNSFLRQYQADYSARKRRKSEEQKTVKLEKKALNIKTEAMMHQRDSFIRALKGHRNDRSYEGVEHERWEAIADLRSTLDYPSFKKIDVDGFFSIWSLGQIIPIPKPTIKRQKTRFAKLLNVLCNEQIDIVKRYDQALSSELRIRGVNEGLISKILTLHDPAKYCVINSKSKAALNKYGIELPRGLSSGEKYKITCDFLVEICRETNIENLAILDYYLYLEG